LVRSLFNEEFLKLPDGEIPALVIKGQTEEVRTLDAESATWKHLEAAVAYRSGWSSPPYVYCFV